MKLFSALGLFLALSGRLLIATGQCPSVRLLFFPSSACLGRSGFDGYLSRAVYYERRKIDGTTATTTTTVVGVELVDGRRKRMTGAISVRRRAD